MQDDVLEQIQRDEESKEETKETEERKDGEYKAPSEEKKWGPDSENDK